MLVQIVIGLVTALSAFTGNEMSVVNTQPTQEEERATLSPQEYLQRRAGPDFELLNRIVIAESGWKKDIKNPISTASGLFQYLNSTFLEHCINKYNLAKDLTEKNDPYIQIDCATKMILEDNGLSHWSESQHLWTITKR